MTLDFAALWEAALRYHDFVAASDQHRGLWEGLYRIARIPDWARIAAPREGRRFLVLAEDWCGDASNTIPTLARWVDETPGLELRILRRDENPDLMDRYRTNGSRSIPIVIALDGGFRELGHWGPRPRELQAWVMEHRGKLAKSELYPQVRRWYAKDRGETTLREVMEAAGLQNIQPPPTENSNPSGPTPKLNG
ncbi:MAG TPA: thioredoxin family protein [Gemmatimonadales bacterium]|nr:thioredoxin family protein [Gemmatimonadales bacterium]